MGSNIQKMGTNFEVVSDYVPDSLHCTTVQILGLMWTFLQVDTRSSHKLCIDCWLCQRLVHRSCKYKGTHCYTVRSPGPHFSNTQRLLI